VRVELPFLRQENERLGTLLDNRDDMLRKAKKMRKDLRASLEDARTRVAELETQVLDSLRLIPLRLALLFRMRLIVLIAPSFLQILLCLRRSMPPSVRN
jgi:signal transduction histidine kinase